MDIVGTGTDSEMFLFQNKLPAIFRFFRCGSRNRPSESSPLEGASNEGAIVSRISASVEE